MKRIIIFSVCLLFSAVLQAQLITKTVNVNVPGTLSTLIASNETKNIGELKIRGNIDARDFDYITYFIRFPNLSKIDIGSANILAYEGRLFNSMSKKVYPANEIPSYSFYLAHSLVEIILPQSLHSIGEAAFSSCENLFCITIPSSVTKIENYAFSKCVGLSCINFGSSVDSIGYWAFHGCEKLTQIEIPKSVSFIRERAFDQCSNLSTVKVDINNPNFSTVDNVLFNKSRSKLIFFPLGKRVSNYLVPSSVDTICAYSFYGCSRLAGVNLSNRLIFIGKEAFYNCSNLIGISFPASLQSIGQAAFCGCSKVVTITTPERLNDIGYSAFSNCTSLSEVNILGTLTETESSLFSGCIKLVKAVLPNSVTTIKDGTFSGCQSLTSLTLPASLTSIEKRAFAGCSKLSNLELPESVKSIGYRTFDGCSSLQTVKIPPSVERIDNEAFIGIPCYLDIDPGNPYYKSIDGVLFNKNGTEIIHCPTSKTGKYIIPESVKSINGSVFYDCQRLTSISMPTNINNVSSNNFYHCDNLQSLYVHVVIPIDFSYNEENIFSGINFETCQLYVPIGTKEAYQSAAQWKNFQNIVEMPGFTLSKDTVNFKSTESSRVIELSCNNVGWRANSDSEWLTVSPTAQDSSEQLTIVTTTNSTDTERIGKIIVNATSFSGDVLDPKVITVTQAGASSSQTTLTIELTDPGTLSSVLSQEQKNTVIKLILIGNIDARDFKTIRDEMLKLTELDLSMASIDAYSGSEGTSSNTDTYLEDEVPESALDAKNGLTLLILPNSITSIGKDALNGCNGLYQITIPNSVVSIGDWAFENCSFMDVTIPNSVLTMGEGVFSNCGKLSSVTLSNSLQSINRKTFQYCSSLTNVEVPEPVTSIKYAAFRDCVSLKSATIPGSATLIEDDAFSSCDLTSVYVYAQTPPVVGSSYSFSDKTKGAATLFVLPGLKGTYQNAEVWNEFAHVEEMPGVYLPEGDTIRLNSTAQSLQSEVSANVAWSASSNAEWLIIDPTTSTDNFLGYYVSENTSNVERIGQITLTAEGVDPKIIKVIQSGQNSLTIEVNLAGTLSSLLTAQQKNNVAKLTVTGNIDARDFKTIRDEMPGLTDVDLSGASIMAYSGSGGTGYNVSEYPLNVVPERAFAGSIKLLSLFLPKSAIAIDDYALQACTSLISMRISSSVKTIGEGAFEGCGKLVSLYSYPEQPGNLEEYVFSGVNTSSCTLFVPFGCIEIYENSGEWDKFAHMEEMPGFIFSDDTLRFEAAGQKQVELKTNTTWFADTEDSWLTFSPSGGNNNAQLTITVGENSGTESRAGKLKISSPYTDSKEITVIQAGKITELTIHVDIPGTLGSLLANVSTENILKLTITGNIDFRDFMIFVLKMPFLEEIDLSAVTIAAYSGREGNYPANELPAYAFTELYYIKNVILPENLTSIGEKAFAERTQLTSVTFGPSLEEIGMLAFDVCEKLTSLVIPSSVTLIRQSAFERCSGLKTISVHSSEPAMLNSPVFSGVDKSQCKLYVPAGKMQTYKDAGEWGEFINTEEEGIDVGEGKLIEGPTAHSLNRVISANVLWNVYSDVNWLTVTPNIEKSYIQCVFTENTNDFDRNGQIIVTAEGFNSQTIPVIQLGQRLVSINVEVPGTLGSLISNTDKKTITNLKITGTIDARDFRVMSQEMPMLTFLDLTEATVVAYSGTEGPRPNVTEYPADAVPDFAFYNNSTLNKISLPHTVVDIRRNAFYGCMFLSDVTLPEQVAILGDGVFYRCPNLQGIDIPSSVTKIGQYCFSGCSKLRSIDIPSSVSSIGQYCFSSCNELASLSLEASVTSIEKGCFSGCSALTSFVIPASVTAIRDNAFSGCRSLESIIMFEQIQNMGDNCFGGCTSLTSIDIPTSVTYLGQGAFAQSGLISIYLPSSVQSVGSGCFFQCQNLTSVSLPSGLVLIDTDAFNGCDQLNSIYCYSELPVKLGTNVFSGVDKNTCVLTVPFGFADAYKAADQWKDFFNVDEAPGITFSSNTVVISGGGGSVNVDATSNISWNAYSSDSWLTVTPLFFDGSGIITFTAEANPGSLLRTTSVQISSNEADPQIITVTQLPVAEQTSYFVPAWTGSGTDLMNIRVVSAKIDDEYLAKGDEIGIFDGNICVGAGVIGDPVSTTYTIEIPVSADNGFGNGYTTGHSISFKLWKKETDKSYSNIIAMFTNPENGQNISPVSFAPGETVAVWLSSTTNLYAPVAHAGDDQVVDENTKGTLDGTRSGDNDGDPVSYRWIVPEGITLNSNSIAKPDFIAPEVDRDSVFKVALVVSDGEFESEPDTVRITVRNVVKAPVVNAGEDFSVSEGTSIRLIGQVVSEVANENLTISWASEDGFKMRNSNQLISYCEAPLVDAERVISFVLTVNDGMNIPVRDTVKVTITKDNEAPEIYPMTFVLKEDELGEFVLNCSDDNDPMYKLTPEVIKDPHNADEYDFSFGRFFYLPQENYFGKDSLTIQVKDKLGKYSEPGVIHIIVEPVNDVPQASILEIDAQNDNLTEIDLKQSISDVETPAGDLQIKFATFDDGNPCLFGGTFSNLGNNVFKYDNPAPVNDYDYMIYKVSDGENTSSSNVVRIYNLVTTKSAVSYPSVLAFNDTVNVYFGKPAIFELLGVNTDYPFKKLTGEITAQPEKGQLSGFGLKNYNGNILTSYQATYKALSNEESTDKISFRFSDGKGNTAEGTIVLKIVPQEVVPYLQPIAAQFLGMNQQAKIPLNVDDADSNPEQLIWTIGNTNETNLVTSVVSENGQTYLLVEPALNYEGTSLLSVTVKDQSNLADETTFGLTVINDNIPYFTSVPQSILQEDQTYTYNVTAVDDDNDNIYLSIPNAPQWLSFTANQQGTGTLSGTLPSDLSSRREDFNFEIWATDSIIEVPVIQALNLHVNYFPVFVQVSDTTVNAGEKLSYLVKVSDFNAGDKLQIWSDNLPAWLTLTDYGDGSALLKGILEKDESYNGEKRYDFTLLSQDDEGSPVVTKGISVSVNFSTGSPFIGNTPEDIKVYPNPTNGIVYIELDEMPDKGAFYEIYNLDGRRFAIQKLESQRELVNLSSFVDGIYILKVNTNNKNQSIRISLTH